MCLINFQVVFFSWTVYFWFSLERYFSSCIAANCAQNHTIPYVLLRACILKYVNLLFLSIGQSVSIGLSRSLLVSLGLYCAMPHTLNNFRYLFISKEKTRNVSSTAGGYLGNYSFYQGEGNGTANSSRMQE